MIRALAMLVLSVPASALAQSAHDHSAMQGTGRMVHNAATPQSAPRAPVQGGQSAFAAIQEIVAILQADPATDWSKVDIEALRQHLIDMNNVTLQAEVTREPAEGGQRFVVTGSGPVRESIRRMVMAHAATMNGVNGWRFEAAENAGGATLTVYAPASDAAKLNALGFIGVMTSGMHHQAHHLMIARGGHPHH